MTVKEWLGRGITVELEIKSLKEATARAEEQLCKTTGDISTAAVQESNLNRYEIKLYKYLHLKELTERRIAKLINIQNEVLMAIEKLQDPLHRIVLTERYISGKPFPEIANDIHYSERWTIELVNKAIAEVGKLKTAI